MLNGLGGRLDCEGPGVPGVAVDDKLRRSEYRDRRRYLRHEKKRENLGCSTVNVLGRQKRMSVRNTNLASIRAAVSTPSVVDIVRPPASTFFGVLKNKRRVFLNTLKLQVSRQVQVTDSTLKAKVARRG